MKLELSGVPNLHMVSPQFYRSAQPTAVGFLELEKMGIKSIINLRAFHDDNSVFPYGWNMLYYHINCKSWHPEEEDVIRFLKIVIDKANQPCLVHCMQGSDRTGMMVACYRIIVQGWTREAAIKEMRSIFGFHWIWFLIPYYLKKMDVEKIKSVIK